MDDRDDLSTVSTAVTSEFISQRAATFHEAFGVESHFNTVMLKYQSKEISDLEQTLKRYQSLAPNDQVDFDFDLLRCTWHDVLRELERAQAAVLESDGRGKRFHRRVWRGLGSTGPVIAPGLAAIPDNLCVLHGGLAVVFSLARHRSQNRQKILQAFEDIPSVIMMAYGKAESIPKDRPGRNRLLGMVGDLQQTLLDTIPVLIDELNPGTFLNKARSPFRTCKIDELLDAVRSRSKRVHTCAEEIMDNIIVDANQTIHANDKITKDIHVIAQHTEGEVGELRGKIEEILKHQKSFQATLDAISGKNSLLSFLLEYLKPNGPTDEKSSTTSLPIYEPATPMTPKQLLTLMNVHHLGALDEEQYTIRKGHSLSTDNISHAATMFQSPQVQQLLHSPGSGVVLVNGCTDRAQSTKVSSVSYVCATLTHALRRPGTNIVLSFFCGLHSSSNDDLNGPQGLMRSLVAFLLLSLVQNEYISDTEPIWFSDVQGDLMELSLRDICHLFYRLVELVPREVKVYCVVDGISYYERQDWKDDYDLMMECFSGIIGNERIKAVFKLLFTSPTISRWLPDLKPEQRVSLRNTRSRGSTNPEVYLQSAFGSLVRQEG